jgi:hypothetical protein
LPFAFIISDQNYSMHFSSVLFLLHTAHSTFLHPIILMFIKSTNCEASRCCCTLSSLMPLRNSYLQVISSAHCTLFSMHSICFFRLLSLLSRKVGDYFLPEPLALNGRAETSCQYVTAWKLQFSMLQAPSFRQKTETKNILNTALASILRIEFAVHLFVNAILTCCPCAQPIKHHAMKAYGEWMYIDPHFTDLGTSWRWVVNFIPRPLYPRGKGPRYPLDSYPEPVWKIWRRKKILDTTGTRTPTPRSSSP